MDVKETLFPNIPERISGLEEIAENLWWSWHPAARMLFKRLGHRAWKESLHNPDKMLRELPKEILESAASDSEYLKEYDIVIARFRNDLEQKGCRYLENIADPSINPIAYFSAEYGLHHSIPFYAGGLGFLAGDFMKECIKSNAPRFSARRMVKEYFEKFYAKALKKA
jgi:glycogen phosphorylase